MKIERIVLACVVLFAGVNSLSGEYLAGKSIKMKRDHKLYANGKYKYTAKAGETLYVVKEKPCRKNPMQKCLVVRHKKYGLGFAKKKELLK